jgi:hypothetical protein
MYSVVKESVGLRKQVRYRIRFDHHLAIELPGQG